MNRKLHNTVTALFATSGLLALSLIAANPVPQGAATPGMQVARVEAAASRLEASAHALDQRLQAEADAGRLAALETRATALSAVAEAFDQAQAVDGEPPKARPGRRSHRGRQSVAMPFFSFFPKG